MAADGVVETVDPAVDGGGRPRPGEEGYPPDHFGLE